MSLHVVGFSSVDPQGTAKTLLDDGYALPNFPQLVSTGRTLRLHTLRVLLLLFGGTSILPSHTDVDLPRGEKTFFLCRRTYIHCPVQPTSVRPNAPTPSY